MPTPTECVCCQEITATADKTGTSELSTIRCITEHEGFDAVCLNVWVLQACYFNYRQHYGTRDIRDEPQHEWVLSCMKANIHLCLFNNKLHHIQAIQIYRLSAINKLVLGLAWKKNACYTTQLCSEQNPVKVSFCWPSLHWLQVPTFYTMMYCWYVHYPSCVCSLFSIVLTIIKIDVF